jgi:polysaccharide pyruvyl transferase WcaK-like protein
MDLLFVRDEISLSYCRDWECDNVNEGADICYSRFLNYQAPVGIGAGNGQINKQRKRIGVIVRDWKHNEEGNGFRQTLLDIVDSPEYAGYEFTFIIFSDLQDLQWKGIINERKYALLKWDPFNNHINDFLDTLNGFDGFITARYHGGVFASLLNKPAVCIAIEPKLSILSEQIKGFRLWDKPFRTEDLKEAIRVFDDNNFDCSGSVNLLKKKADAMFDSLRQYLREL